MTLTRRAGTLAALALVLGACSTPADLTAPTLEPQFGTPHKDVGVDVSFYTSGPIFVLTEDDDLYEMDDYLL